MKDFQTADKVYVERELAAALLLPNSIPELRQATGKILIDDSGWGFPLGGVLCGAYNTATGELRVEEIPVSFFQEPRWSSKEYLREFASKAADAVKGWDTNLPVEMCTGYVLNRAELLFRGAGYKLERKQIGEPLQSLLEQKHKEYVEGLGYGGYYDPKELTEAEIKKEFWKAVSWLHKEKKMHLAKSGWGFFQRHLANHYVKTTLEATQ
jgi:hypothetical protein